MVMSNGKKIVVDLTKESIDKSKIMEGHQIPQNDKGCEMEFAKQFLGSGIHFKYRLVPPEVNDQKKKMKLPHCNTYG